MYDGNQVIYLIPQSWGRRPRARPYISFPRDIKGMKLILKQSGDGEPTLPSDGHSPVSDCTFNSFFLCFFFLNLFI